MKKILYVAFVLIFLLVSCSRDPVTSKSSAGSLTATHDLNGVPMIMYATFEDLKDIKNEYDTKDSDGFMSYLENEKTKQYMTGMWNYDNASVLINELCSTVVPLLDCNIDNFGEIAFYWESYSVYQLIMFDESKRVLVSIDTVNSTQPKELQLGVDAEFVTVKDVQNDCYSAKLYEVKNADYLFFADIYVEDTYIVLKTMNIETFEEFEACFARLEFVKIGDLLERSNTETTNAESVSHTGLSDEEATTEINIATELSVESVTYDLFEAETTE